MPTTTTPFESALQDCIGQVLDADRRGRDAVNVAMIRNYCDALGDQNPVYVDPDAAVRHGFGSIVAPPAMLRTWTMVAPPEQLVPAETGIRTVYDLLEDEGFTAKAGTNCNHTLVRYFVPGDELVASTRLLSVSAQKQTALGTGHFLDTGTTYWDASGAVVAEMVWRSLRYQPATTGSSGSARRPIADAGAGAGVGSADQAAADATVAAGQRLASADVAITPALIIGGAMASRDYQPVHHDRDYACTQGMPDYFMNMMTSAGLVSRYTTDWTGPGARIKTMNLTLGVPNHPGDTLRLDATVAGVQPDGEGRALVELSITGRNSLGRHVRADVGVSISVAG